MYLSFYNLEKMPFQISTDPDFLWLGEKHKEMLSIFQYGVLENKGFLLLTGDVGTGKTTLINAFVNSLGDNVIVARVSDPGLTQLGFLKYIAEMFMMETAFENKSEFLLLFTKFLNRANHNDKRVLLIIDEAQHVTDEILEEIRLLSNIERQGTKLLNIFFVGQNELDDTLEKYQNRALQQRISINHILEPFGLDETTSCIEYRLQVAGSSKKIFTSEAIAAIHKISDGFPRLINIICDHALLLGYFQKNEEISAEIVRQCAHKLHPTHVPNSETSNNLENYSDDWLQDADFLLSVDATRAKLQSKHIIEQVVVEEPKAGKRRWLLCVPALFILLVTIFFSLRNSSVTLSSKSTPARKDKMAASLPTLTETPSYVLKTNTASATPSSGNENEEATEVIIEPPHADELKGTPPHTIAGVPPGDQVEGEFSRGDTTQKVVVIPPNQLVSDDGIDPPTHKSKNSQSVNYSKSGVTDGEEKPNREFPVIEAETQFSMPREEPGKGTVLPSIDEDKEIEYVNDSVQKEQEPVSVTKDDPGAVIDWLLDSRKD